MFYAYLDESSGEKRDSGYLVIAGCIAREHTWKTLNKAWAGKLRKYGMKYFHAKEIFNPKGPYCQLSVKVKNELIADFASVMTDRMCSIVGNGLPLAEFWEIRQDFPKMPITEVHACLDMALSTAVLWNGRNPESDRIAVVLDEGMNHGSPVFKLWKHKRQLKKSKLNIGSLTVGDDKEVMPLQMADLVAHQMRFQLDQMSLRITETDAILEKRGQLTDSMELLVDKFTRNTCIATKEEIRAVFTSFAEYDWSQYYQKWN